VQGKLNKTEIGVNTTNQNSYTIPPSLLFYFYLFYLLLVLVLKWFTVFIQSLFFWEDCNEICKNTKNYRNNNNDKYGKRKKERKKEKVSRRLQPQNQ
jgi:hypothetical protein